MAEGGQAALAGRQPPRGVDDGDAADTDDACDAASGTRSAAVQAMLEAEADGDEHSNGREQVEDEEDAYEDEEEEEDDDVLD
eukprot:scaffold3120_cov161-Prasinococcus_capsulatus_cf.AAC.1